MILASKEDDEESAKEWLNTIINERKEREENEIRKEEIAERNGKKKLLKENKNTWNGSERRKKNTRNGSERKNSRNGSERMKFNLSYKKYALEQKVGLQIKSPIKR
ncbi:hypothetical protein AVEN_77759-1 [Araneus ventricosus]|uniref:PH domain-containing protein n=1 Tax=Araneus ventricosus TaxID=182803 RepID=A0A4Y2MPT6_ARAVE|nr:hypothetical protein AVEN_77759-1 [Araneus ventricosus]